MVLFDFKCPQCGSNSWAIHYDLRTECHTVGCTKCDDYETQLNFEIKKRKVKNVSQKKPKAKTDEPNKSTEADSQTDV